MTTLTKLLEPHARPAQVLLKRAKRLSLTSAQRLALPAHLDAEDAHLHHALEGHRPLEVGDVLLDERGGMYVVQAARETIWRVTGPLNALLAFAYASGQQHERVMLFDDALAVLPGEALQARIATAGLRYEAMDAEFVPQALVVHRHQSAHDHDHDHVHHEGCGHDHHHHHHGHD